MNRTPVDDLLHLRFPALPDRLKGVRAAVAEALATRGCADGCSRDVVLAVDEACQNIIRHAYGGQAGDIVLEMKVEDEDRLVVLLADFAAPVDPGKVQPRPLDELRPGGLGTHFMRQAMDDVAFLPPPPGVGNLLRMSKRIRWRP